jgi:hypothetical protein
MRKALIDFGTISDTEVPIHNLKNGATALHVIAESYDHDSNLQAALFYLSLKLAEDARELQDWFDGAIAVFQSAKD